MREVTNKTEKNLKRLAELAGIDTKYGWKKELSAILKLKQSSLISTWIKRNNIPEKQRRMIDKRGFPQEKWWRDGEPRGKDTAEKPDLNQPLTGGDTDLDDLEFYLAKARRILTAKEPGTTYALKNVLELLNERLNQANRLTEQADRIIDLENKIAMLEHEKKITQAAGKK
ncbi:hypothetical protein ACFL2O_10800 [Thermodesulfobacteriota bacterium]